MFVPQKLIHLILSNIEDYNDMVKSNTYFD